MRQWSIIIISPKCTSISKVRINEINDSFLSGKLNLGFEVLNNSITHSEGSVGLANIKFDWKPQPVFEVTKLRF